MQGNEMIVLKPAQIFDGTGAPSEKNTVVLICGRKIVYVGSEGGFDIPSDARYIDLPDQTVLPGLVDSHIHLALGTYGTYLDMMRDTDGVQLATGIVNAREMLRAGITTAKDCGARNRVAFDLRDAWKLGLVEGPRILVSGRPLCITRGHFHFCNNNECDGPWEVRTRVRQMVAEGADFIKLMASGGGTPGTDNSRASFEEEEILAAVQEAEKFGKTVTAHCEAHECVGRATRAGVHTLAHLGFIKPDGTRGFDEKAVRTIVQKGLYVDPTLQTASAQRDALREKKKANTLTDQEKATLEAAEYKIKVKQENLARMMRMGVKFAAGSDGWGLGKCTRLVRTLELMVEAGVSPSAVLVSATKNGAESIRMGHLFGTICEGKEADIIAVDGDPTENISCLRSPVMVIQSGRIIKKIGDRFLN
jgi:imidazolonepropionase-like amidohydrolase